MLDAAVPVLREIYKRFPQGCADLEVISKIVTGTTLIDRTHYVGFDTPRANPIWGSFKRFEQPDAPYAGNVTIVEVRYAQHLTEDERVFVVSKELCHSLEATDGTHVVTDSAIDDLVAEFSVFSSQRSGRANARDVNAFNLEMLATIVVAELVCPVAHRRTLMAAAGDDPDWDALGAQVKIPSGYRRGLCSIDHMGSVERMLKSFGIT
jgi:hypothetical protein